jgi:anti-anti-sigma factor
MDTPAANAATVGGSTRPYGVEIALLRDGATSRIIVSGEIDIATATQLQTALAPAHHAHAKKIVLDLQRVTFIDSSGLHALIGAHEHWGDRLRIILGHATSRIIDLAGIGEHLPIAEQ